MGLLVSLRASVGITMKFVGVALAIAISGVAGFDCPDWLKPICSIVKSGKCLAKCMPRLGSCITDPACRQNMENFGLCMKDMPKNATADQTQACLVPDNEKRSEF